MLTQAKGLFNKAKSATGGDLGSQVGGSFCLEALCSSCIVHTKQCWDVTGVLGSPMQFALAAFQACT